LNPDSGIGHDNLGNTYLSIGELDDAEAAFDASPAPSRWTYMNRGLVHYYKGDYAAAVADERRAIDLAPEVPEPWGFLADAYRFIPEKGQESLAAYAKAIDLAEQALDLNPSDLRLTGWLGVYYAHAGQETKAAEQLVELLQHTEHLDVYYFASQIALSLGQTERALDYLEATIKNGWTRELLRLDPDLASLSSNPRYVAVLAPMD
jgi:tetratricopeptide (TPR) repeat protein